MRVFLILLLIIHIFSCQTKLKAKNDSTTSSEEQPDLPEFIQNYLAQKLSGWKLAPKESWDDTTYKKYQTGSSKLNYIVADLNCDDKPDFAAILKDSSGKFAIFEIHSFDQTYLHTELESDGGKSLLDFGIRFLKPKTTIHLYDESTQVFECGAIEKFYVNRQSIKIFYSNAKGSFVLQQGE